MPHHPSTRAGGASVAAATVVAIIFAVVLMAAPAVAGDRSTTTTEEDDGSTGIPGLTVPDSDRSDPEDTGSDSETDGDEEEDDSDTRPDRTTTTADEPDATDPRPTTTESEDTQSSPITIDDRVDPDAEEDSGDGGTSGALMLALGLLLGATAGVAAGWFAGRQSVTKGNPPPPGAVVPAPGAVASADPSRLTLVNALIAAIDLTANDGLREQLERALASAGVVPIVVDGEPFDPERHHAVDRLATHDASQHNTVLTDRPGWRDGNQILRNPDVIVYRQD